jgi:hypothetical protein
MAFGVGVYAHQALSKHTGAGGAAGARRAMGAAGLQAY